VSSLLKLGLDPNAINGAGDAPMHVAARAGNLKVYFWNHSIVVFLGFQSSISFVDPTPYTLHPTPYTLGTHPCMLSR
jgi:hypothetical protein